MMEIVRKRLLKRWSDPEPTECMIEIAFDADELAGFLGRKAFANKSKRGSALHGIIKTVVRPTRDRAAG